MSNGARGADPCAQSGTATVGTFERKKHGVSYFHDEGMTITCPAMENGGSHTLTTQENGDKKKKTSANHRPHIVLSDYLWQDARYPRYGQVSLVSFR